jgi:beta-aspartyl-peptidase (threonine type)
MMLVKCSLIVLALTAFAAAAAPGGPPAAGRKVVLVIHGGAGVRPASKMTTEARAAYEATLTRALRAGHDALTRDGGTSLDAVEAAITVMEDSPLFNAGKGAVFTHDGRIELDASIMEGRQKKAGAVAGVSRIKNPISAARAVMEKSPHVLMVGDGAERFALAAGVREVNPVEHWTEARWKQLLDELKAEQEKEKSKAGGGAHAPGGTRPYFGTVGAVALDRHGDLAAGTSTGGQMNKRHGRVGDSPVIGAGTYADNASCGVSGTGHGEVFIRWAVAHDIAAEMALGKKSVAEACRAVMAKLPKEPDGVGGVIALDARGNVAAEFDTEGMFRGTVTEQGDIDVAVYKPR